MPKMKSHRGAAKRFKMTGTGKIKRRHMNHRHILTKKDQKRKVRLRKPALVDAADQKRIARIISV